MAFLYTVIEHFLGAGIFTTESTEDTEEGQSKQNPWNRLMISQVFSVLSVSSVVNGISIFSESLSLLAPSHESEPHSPPRKKNSK
jgi:hypothetical protein